MLYMRIIILALARYPLHAQTYEGINFCRVLNLNTQVSTNNNKMSCARGYARSGISTNIIQGFH